MRDIPFVDAHVHLWDLGRLSYPWLTPPFSDDGPNGNVEPIARTYSLDDYLADADGWTIAGMVHVDAGAAAEAALEETRWLQDMADGRGLPNGIVAFAALDDPNVEQLLAAHAAHANMRGIRHIVNWHPDSRRTYTPRDVTGDPAWQRGFSALQKYGLSFDLQCYPGQFANVAAAIARNPETPVILNHCGMPVDGLEHWRQEVARLAELPNVFVKLSGFGFIKRDWQPEDMKPFALEVIERFGPERVLFASDFPTDKLFSSCGQILETFADIAAGFSEDERRDMFGRNANRVYRLGLDI
ncbi:amidohydrolase family protein [Pedomonas mirosovicensis]|uniref:amidohydrolase family protein n=1 Tax=Pedomonas mirosovicensis TaxID=2908641 RepID=UPI002169FBEA|nr:amidohydrolase family protein [Pedomonas mirosovicensis]MCH8686187.1 amidohydrolase family protein [Pedomonas mirosovicensis]